MTVENLGHSFHFNLSISMIKLELLKCQEFLVEKLI